MISNSEKENLLAVFARAEKDSNPESKINHYHDALEIAQNLWEQADTEEERLLISNVRFANCRSMVNFLASTGALTNAQVTRCMKLIHEFRAELQSLIEQDAIVRDQIKRFLGKQTMVPQDMAMAVTKILLGEATPAAS